METRGNVNRLFCFDLQYRVPSITVSLEGFIMIDCLLLSVAVQA